MKGLCVGGCPSQGNPEVAHFSGGPVVKTPPANARDTGSIPGLGSLHMPQGNLAGEPELLSPGATATEACTPREAPQQEKPPL